METGSKYTYSDIFSSDIEKGIKKLSSLILEIDNNLKKVKSIPNTGAGFKELNENLKKTVKYTDELDKINKQRLQVEKQQEKLNKQKLKDAQKLNLEYQKELAVKRQNEAAIRKEAKEYAVLIAEKKELEKLSNKEIKSEKELIRYTNLLVKKRKEMVVVTQQDQAEHKRLTNEINKNTIALKNADASINRHQRSVGNYKTALKGLWSTFAAGMGAMAVFSFLKDSVKLFQIQEQAVKDNEVVFGSYSKTLQKAAADIQKVTTVGDEQTIALMTQAKNFGIANSKTIEATKGAIGLAEKFKKAGLSQETALKGIALAYQGDFTQLQRYIPALKSAKTESEKMAIVQTQMAEGFNLSKEAAKTSGGQLQQFKNEIGDIQEQVGEGLIPVLMGLLKIAQLTLNEMGKSFKDLMTIFEDLQVIFSNWIELSKELIDLFPKHLKESNTFWTSIKQSILDLVNPTGTVIKGVKTLVGLLKEAMVYLGLVTNKGKKGRKKGEKKIDYNDIIPTDKELTENDKPKYDPSINTHLENYRQLQAMELSYYKLQVDDAERIKEFKKQQKIDLLMFELTSGKKLNAIQKQTIENEIELLERSKNKKIDIGIGTAKDISKGIDDEIKKNGDVKVKKGFISKLFSLSDSDKDAIVNEARQIYNQIMDIMQENINREKALNDEKLALADERIIKKEEELAAEQEHQNKLQEMGASYDRTRQDALKKQLEFEKKEKQKALEEDKKIKQKQKNMDIVNANIAIATSVLNALKIQPIWVGIAMSAVMGALGAVQLAQIKSAKYAKGTNYVQLNGNPDGTDTIPAYVDKGERILTRKQNSEIPLTFPNSKIPTAINYYLNRKGETVNKKGEIITIGNENDVYLSEIAENTRNNRVYEKGKLIEERRNNITIYYN